MKHFTDRELLHTNTGLPNQASPEVLASLHYIIEEVLDPLRELLAMPIRITSGYRSPQVNQRVGGSPKSQHTKGEAVDFTCADMARAFMLIRERFSYDQLIWEFGNAHQPEWIHLSLRRPESGKNRKEALRAVREGDVTRYKPFH